MRLRRLTHPTITLLRRAPIAVVLGLIAFTTIVAGTTAHATPSTGSTSVYFHRPPPAAPTVSVGASPYGVAMDPRQRTAFVATGDGVSVVDLTHCTALDSSGCSDAATTLPIGSGDIGILFDPTSRMVYVASAGTNSVVLFSERHCNAQDMTGCGEHVRHVDVGTFPTDVALDRPSQTLYVSNAGNDEPGNTLSMIDTTRCNAQVAAGCGDTPPTVDVGSVPQGMAVDDSTGTLYVTSLLDSNVSVINTHTCNALVQRGCHHLITSPVVDSPAAAIIDPVSKTLYVDNLPPDVLGTVSLIDTTRCNAQVTVGCGSPSPTVHVGSIPSGLAADPGTRTVYVASQEDSSVSAIDERLCNAQRTDGCPARAPSMPGGFDAGAVGVDAVTHTVYLASQDENTLTVLNGNRCNGHQQAGCTRDTPKTPTGSGPAGIALDKTTHTVYVSNQDEDTVSVINSSQCSAARLAGCRRNWPKISVGAFPKAVAIDPSTHTAYVADYEGNSVSVVDISACNAHNHQGCADTPREVAVPGGAYTLVLDRSTHTVYVAEVDDGTVSMIDAATCNAVRHSGCAHAPTTVPVGVNPGGLSADAASKTLYVADKASGVVDLVDMATCNGSVDANCAVVATAAVGTAPRFMAQDPDTHTLYVANRDDDTVSMVDTASCNAEFTAGCSATSPVVAVGHFPYGLAVNQRTHRLYVGEVGDSTVREINGRHCNSATQTGCARQLTAATGGWPTNVAIDPANGTVYVSDDVDADLSIVAMTRPQCRDRRLYD